MKSCWCSNSELAEYSSEYFKCERCHTLITKKDLDNAVYDVKDEEKDLYGKNYWEEEMTRVAGKNTLSEVVDMYLAERAVYWFKYVLKYAKLGGSVAEVGCGLGQLQYIMNRCGYLQKAFELSPDICEYMETQLKVNAVCGPFQSQEGKYDAILAFDLFEHLVEPNEFLELCSESLVENGVICFQTPCYDAGLSYEDMQKSKPKFEKQLKAEQHIYLYSRQSITEILSRHGFTNIIFEPAFFGDDYDMFFVACKENIVVNTTDEIDAYLNSVPNGRLVKSMITLFDSNCMWTEKYLRADRDRTERGMHIQKLEEALDGSEKNSVARLRQVQELENLLKRSEKDSKARLGQIGELSGLLQQCEEDRTLRLEQIDEYSRLLQESENDRVARLEQIEELSRLLQESEADRAARLEQIEELSQLLQESEADRAARLEQIEVLTQLVNSKK